MIIICKTVRSFSRYPLSDDVVPRSLRLSCRIALRLLVCELCQVDVLEKFGSHVSQVLLVILVDVNPHVRVLLRHAFRIRCDNVMQVLLFDFFVFMERILIFVFCVLSVISHRICTTCWTWMYLVAKNFLCPSHTVTLSDKLPPPPVQKYIYIYIYIYLVRPSVNHLDPTHLHYVKSLTSPALSYKQ